MPKGVKIEDIIVGTGAEARRGMTVAANVRIFLNRGDEVTAEYPQPPRTVIDLGRRETIPGLRYGIEGMRVGGRRKLVISPHLAYGEDGMDDFIPPGAVLRCEVELLEVGASGSIRHSLEPAGRQLHIFRPGEAANDTARVQADIHESGQAVAFITRPIPGYGWRRAPHTLLTPGLDATLAGDLLDEALGLPVRAPDECLPHDQLWSDLSEPGNGVTRDQETDTPCATVWVQEDDVQLCYYSIRTDSRSWLESAMSRLVDDLLQQTGP